MDTFFFHYLSAIKEKKPAFFLAFLAFLPAFLLAQPVNDECTGAINISNVTSFCSPNAAYTNVAATPSGFGAATCFGTTEGDVWFTFIATATDVNIVVRGATAQAQGGTLRNPQLALYFGNCGGTINQLECQTAPANAHVVEGYQGGLFVGSRYYIRVQGRAGETGTFQLCINNYNYPVDPASDCPDAAILCDKSPFVVESVTGAGSNNGELDDAACFSNGVPGNNESNSTWFVWTCDQAGSLTFTLTPQNTTDDLDFVIYRLPNGIGNCTGKQILRCMASGDFNFPSRCMGPTGLNTVNTDDSEPAGCGNSNQNNFLAPLNMVSGQTYALVVNNFSSTGNGFSVEFGGSGTFLGPKPQFSTIPMAVCLGTPVSVTDQSTFALGSITGWSWSFGANAQPGAATGPGPHSVIFDQPGVNSVVLAVESNLGCRVTRIQEVIVFPKVSVDTVIAEPDCNGGTNGAVIIQNIREGTAPYQYSWNGMPFTSQNTLSGLGVGVVNLVIRDANNCTTELDIQVNERTLTVAADVIPPLCYGESNGTISLTATNGVGPYTFNWNDGLGFVSTTTQSVFPSGTYTINGIDGTLCKGTFEVSIFDNPPLTLNMESQNISCNGANDGTGTAIPAGGVGNYTYLWSNGQTTQNISNLGPGTYDVTVSDGNECVEFGAITIIEPGELSLNLLYDEDLICFGDSTGLAAVEAVGGVGPFRYSSDGQSFGPSNILTGLTNGDYTLWVEDSEGCRASTTTSITSPVPIVVIAWPDTTLDLGYTVQIRTLVAPDTRRYTYEWMPPIGLSCIDCPEPEVVATINQTYIIKVTDETNCMGFDSVRIMVVDNRPVFAPNVFAPEQSWPNSHFTLFGGPASAGIELLRIFDRWGGMVYEGEDIPMNDPLRGWDGTYRGKAAISGTYTYYAYVEFVDGRKILYEGDVTLVR